MTTISERIAALEAELRALLNKHGGAERVIAALRVLGEK